MLRVLALVILPRLAIIMVWGFALAMLPRRALLALGALLAFGPLMALWPLLALQSAPLQY